MALPTSPTWNIADFSGSTLGGLLTLGPGDLTITPTTSPYFSYNADFSVLTARSADGVLAQLDFLGAAIPSRYTVEVTLRFPAMPHNLGDLETRRAGFVVADDAGRGIAVYFASTGVAVSRVDDFGSVTALPDTTDVTEEIATSFKTIRVAVDSALGRAYVYIGDGDYISPDIKFILPVEETPPTVIDVLRFFVKGLSAQPAEVQIKALRLAGSLVIPNFPPTADAGPDRVASVGSTIRLDGRASFDVEGAPLTYQWTMIDAPFGSQYAADNSSGNTTDDGDADGFTDLLSFTPSSLPAWVAAGDVLRIEDTRHVIATFDNAAGELTVEGETIPDNLSSMPFRIIRQSVLVGAQTETPYAVPDVQGIYRFELVVNDGVSDSEPAEVLASIVGARAPFAVEPDVTPIWKALGDEWSFIENRGVFEEAWRGVSQIMAGKMLEVWQHHYNYSLRDAQRTFQRKWLAYRTLITETNPDEVTIQPRFGMIQASHAFESGDPVVTGQSLIFEYYTGPDDLAQIEVTLTGDTLAQIISDVNAVLAGTTISAYSHAIRSENGTYRATESGTTTDDGDADGYTDTLSFTPLSLPSWVAAGDSLIIGSVRATVATVNNPGGTLTVTAEELPDDLAGVTFFIYRPCRLAFKSLSKGFRVTAGSTAAALLGITTDRWSYLEGVGGSIITDRTYYCGDGVSLDDHNVSRGDLLVLNGGQSFVVDRVLSGADDPLPGQRLLLSDLLPADASEAWAIPSVVLSAEIDYEYEGAYPGDLVKAEVYDVETNRTTDVRGVVVAQKGRQVAANLSEFYGAFIDTDRYEIRLLGVKRRKALPIPEDVVSIPRLQNLIPVDQDPDVWQENIDYILEPLYRDIGGAPIPHLQFRDEVFVDTDTEPPDIFWAELTVFSNDQNVEDRFGLLGGFLRDDASAFSKDFNYVAGVAGLIYAQQRGPSVHTVRVGAQILFGQSFAEVKGIIEEIRDDFSPTTGRLLVRDDRGETLPSEIVRTYYYRKDPLDLTATSGLATNPVTNVPWAVGDSIPQFSPIGAGVNIVDMYNDRKWYVPYVRSGLMTEIEKFHTFLVRFNLDLITLTNLSLLLQFVMRVKPTHTYPLLVGLRNHEDDLDIIDDLEMSLTMHLFDTFRGYPQCFMYDDYRGDGTIWSEFDDGATYFDGIVDIPLDIIEFLLTIEWPGGVLTYDSAFFTDTLVTDVDGVHTGTPGSTFTPTYDMTLPAGTYELTVTIKGGGIVLP